MKFAVTRLMTTSSVTIAWQEPNEIPTRTYSDISLIVILLTLFHKARTLPSISLFLLVDGRLGRSWHVTDARPSLKRRYHSKIWVRLMESSPKAILITYYVAVQVFPSFWQNAVHTRSVFLVILNATTIQKVPSFNWNCMRLREEATTRTPTANRSRHVRTRTWRSRACECPFI
jgi:hypothetical protein